MCVPLQRTLARGGVCLFLLQIFVDSGQKNPFMFLFGSEISRGAAYTPGEQRANVVRNRTTVKMVFIDSTMVRKTHKITSEHLGIYRKIAEYFEKYRADIL